MIKALNSVTKAVATKTTMPILEGILIQTNNDDIKLTCYDKELGIEYELNDINPPTKDRIKNAIEILGARYDIS